MTAYNKNLLTLSQQIEKKILFVLSPNDKMEYEALLNKLKSDNLHCIQQGLTKIIIKLTKQKYLIENQEILKHISIIQDELIIIQENIRNELISMVQTKATEYFMEYFKSDFIAIDFYEKTEGVQLGQKAKIILKNTSNSIAYYVKTHRGGLLLPTIPNVRGACQVDPKELFVYKVFELIGLTPETHFFFHKDASSFYIATKDAGFDELMQKQKNFLTYEHLKENNKTALCYKKISDVVDAWNKIAIQTVAMADKIEINLGIMEKNVIKALSKANILSRIFLLEDFATNGSNMGFILEDDLSNFRVIDFVTPHKGETYRIPSVFDGFLSGNGSYIYSNSADKIIQYSLYAIHQTKKMQMAREIVNELTIPVGKIKPLNNETLDMVRSYVKRILQECPGILNLSNVLKDLDYYVDSIKFNLRKFSEGFLLYTEIHTYQVLKYLLPRNKKFIVINPAAIVFKNSSFLMETIKFILRKVLEKKVVIIPIYLYGCHWVGAVFRCQADGVIQVIYNDPAGDKFECESGMEKFITTTQTVIDEITSGMVPTIIDLQLTQQSKRFDSGPLAVDNLVKIARNCTLLDNLSRNEIIKVAGLQQYIDSDTIANIRNEHKAIFHLLGLQVPEAININQRKS